MKQGVTPKCYITVHYIPIKKKSNDKPCSLKGFNTLGKLCSQDTDAP